MFVACSIYSLIEENDEDSLYFFTKSGLGSKVDFLNTNVSNRNTHIPSFGEDHSPERYQLFTCLGTYLMLKSQVLESGGARVAI